MHIFDISAQYALIHKFITYSFHIYVQSPEASRAKLKSKKEVLGNVLDRFPASPESELVSARDQRAFNPVAVSRGRRATKGDVNDMFAKSK